MSPGKRARVMAWGNLMDGQMETEMKTEIDDGYWLTCRFGLDCLSCAVLVTKWLGQCRSEMPWCRYTTAREKTERRDQS